MHGLLSSMMSLHVSLHLPCFHLIDIPFCCHPPGPARPSWCTTGWCSGAVSTGALVLRLNVHALQQEVPFGTCCLLLRRGRLTAGCMTRCFAALIPCS